MVKIVNCPQCNALVPWKQDKPWKPFCSERCKLIDLGGWASEKYRIEETKPPNNDIADFDLH